MGTPKCTPQSDPHDALIVANRSFCARCAAEQLKPTGITARSHHQSRRLPFGEGFCHRKPLNSQSLQDPSFRGQRPVSRVQPTRNAPTVSIPRRHHPEVLSGRGLRFV